MRPAGLGMSLLKPKRLLAIGHVSIWKLPQHQAGGRAQVALVILQALECRGQNVCVWALLCAVIALLGGIAWGIWARWSCFVLLMADVG